MDVQRHVQLRLVMPVQGHLQQYQHVLYSVVLMESNQHSQRRVMMATQMMEMDAHQLVLLRLVSIVLP